MLYFEVLIRYLPFDDSNHLLGYKVTLNINSLGYQSIAIYQFFLPTQCAVSPSQFLLLYHDFLWFLLFNDLIHSLGLVILLETTLLSNKIIAIYHDCFSPIIMALFHFHYCWLLYFEFFIIPPHGWVRHLFKLLLPLEEIYWDIVLSPYIINIFLSAQW